MWIRSIARIAGLVAMLAFMSTATPIVAQDATPTAVSIALSPDATVDGLGLPEWSARLWQWSLSFTPELDPSADDTGARCGLGQSGPVYFLAGAPQTVERACTLPLGVHILVPLLVSACSTVEDKPFFGRDEADLIACANNAIDLAENAVVMTAMQLTVDGQAVDNLADYRTTTPLISLVLPEDNVLGSTQRVADSVGGGYQIMLSPLAEGEHEIVIAVPNPLPVGTVTITYHITVASGEYVQTSS